jgi:hypothetical protein
MPLRKLAVRDHKTRVGESREDSNLAQQKRNHPEAFYVPLMIITVKVRPRLVQTLKAPTAQLTGERFILGLDKVFGNDLFHK